MVGPGYSRLTACPAQCFDSFRNVDYRRQDYTASHRKKCSITEAQWIEQLLAVRQRFVTSCVSLPHQNRLRVPRSRL
jgi:hypothetical protein